MRAVLSWSYQNLHPPAARMFRLLGLHPGPEITAAAAAQPGRDALPVARRLLRELTRCHLLAEPAAGRYAFHDLLRAYAAEQATALDSDHDRRAATGRMLDHYLHTARAADLQLNPLREPITRIPPPPRRGVTPETMGSRQRALAWFEAEQQVLLAAVNLAAETGFDVHAWQLPWAMVDFLDTRGHWREWAATQRCAVAAATRSGDVGRARPRPSGSWPAPAPGSATTTRPASTWPIVSGSTSSSATAPARPAPISRSAG